VHRAEVAALREQLMAKKLAAAEDALAQHEARLAGLEAVRGETLLQVQGSLRITLQQVACACAYAVQVLPVIIMRARTAVCCAWWAGLSSWNVRCSDLLSSCLHVWTRQNSTTNLDSAKPLLDACLTLCRACSVLQAFQGLIGRLLEALAAAAQQAADAEATAAAADAAAADKQQEEQEGEEQQDSQQQQDAAAAAAAALAAAEAARRLCLAQMQGFSRMYCSQVVQLGLAEQLLQHVDSLELQEQDVRAAVLGPLYLE
jgi:hydrogenase maturation factor HypF (carbamoyltransferase family)